MYKKTSVIGGVTVVTYLWWFGTFYGGGVNGAWILSTFPPGPTQADQLWAWTLDGAATPGQVSDLFLFPYCMSLLRQTFLTRFVDHGPVLHSGHRLATGGPRRSGMFWVSLGQVAKGIERTCQFVSISAKRCVF